MRIAPPTLRFVSTGKRGASLARILDKRFGSQAQPGLLEAAVRRSVLRLTEPVVEGHASPCGDDV